MFKNQIVHVIGDGRSTSIWFDAWHPIGPLCHLISKREIYAARLDINMKVSDISVDGMWMWPLDLWYKYGNVL